MKILDKIIAKQINLKGEKPVTIAFFGDSVTQGCFELYKTSDTTFQTEFRVEEGYHTKLREIIQLLYPSVPINMIYAGISGGNSREGLERVENDVCAYKPDLTIVCFGLNDCCSGLDGIDIYRKSLKGIFEKLKSCGSEIIFMTPNLMADSVSSEVEDKYIREVYDKMIKANALNEYVEAARQVCKDENILICDCYKIWSTLKERKVDTTRLLANRINHPVEKMHWLFAFKLAEMIFLTGE